MKPNSDNHPHNGERLRVSQPTTGQVLPFRPRASAIRPDPVLPAPQPAEAQVDAGEADDFRHRMIVNTAGLACAMLLVASGIWLASSIANLRNTQDCVLSGRRNCAPIAVDKATPAMGQH